MGAWGHGADENDDVYDVADLDFGDRVYGLQARVGESCVDDELLGELRAEWTAKGKFDDPGVCVLFLKMGGKLDGAALNQALRLLEVNFGGVSKVNEPVRWESKHAELAFVKSAINNGGAAPGPPVGSRGIHGAMADGALHTVGVLAFEGGRWAWAARKVDETHERFAA